MLIWIVKSFESNFVQIILYGLDLRQKPANWCETDSLFSPKYGFKCNLHYKESHKTFFGTPK